MGSIQTLQHSFYVQRYDKGSGEGRCGWTVRSPSAGAASSVRATATPGYLKKYVYDTRLKYSAPPYFPRWVNAQWSQRYFGEVNTPAELKS